MTATITVATEAGRYLVRVQAPTLERARIVQDLRAHVRFRTCRGQPGAITVAGCHWRELQAWADQQSYAGAIVEWPKVPGWKREGESNG